MVEYMDSFDLYNTAQLARYYPTNAPNNSVGSGIVSGSSGALTLDGRWYSGGSVSCPVTGRDTYIVGFDFKYDSATSPSATFLEIGTPSSVFCGFSITSDGTISTRHGNTSPGVLIPATVCSVQIKYVISPTAGVLVIRVDGVTVLNLTALNTGSTNITLIRPRYAGSNFGYYDNFWVLNTLGSHSNTFPIGRMAIQTKYPTGDGTYSDLTPSSGSSHYTQVDETPADDDTTFNASATPGAKDTYTIPALTGAIAQIHAVKTTATVRKTDVDPKTAHVIVKSGATLGESPDISVPLNYTPCSLLLTDDPATSAQWTESGVNSIQPGIRVVS